MCSESGSARPCCTPCSCGSGPVPRSPVRSLQWGEGKGLVKKRPSSPSERTSWRRHRPGRRLRLGALLLLLLASHAKKDPECAAGAKQCGSCWCHSPELDHFLPSQAPGDVAKDREAGRIPDHIFSSADAELIKKPCGSQISKFDYEVTPFGQGCDKAGRPRLVRRYEDRRATQGVEFSICSAEMSQASSEQAGANVSQSNTGTGQSPSSGRRLTEGRLKCLALAAKGITVVSLTQSRKSGTLGMEVICGDSFTSCEANTPPRLASSWQSQPMRTFGMMSTWHLPCSVNSRK